jgi:hypothetical protein
MNPLETDMQAYRQGDAIQMTPDQILALASRHRVDPVQVKVAQHAINERLMLESARIGARRLLGLKGTGK